MSLEKWVEYGWLRRELTSPGEIKDLFGIVDRSLADSRVEAVSTDLRFIAAFNAALSVATTALRASGPSRRDASRPPHQNNRISGAHHRSQPQAHSEIQDIQQQTNKSVYDVAGAVSDQELEAIVKLATELRDSTLTWLRKTHPELLKT